MPATAAALEKAEPVYECLPGWRIPTSGRVFFRGTARAAPATTWLFLRNRTGVDDRLCFARVRSATGPWCAPVPGCQTVRVNKKERDAFSPLAMLSSGPCAARECVCPLFAFAAALAAQPGDPARLWQIRPCWPIRVGAGRRRRDRGGVPGLARRVRLQTCTPTSPATTGALGDLVFQPGA